MLGLERGEGAGAIGLATRSRIGTGRRWAVFDRRTRRRLQSTPGPASRSSALGLVRPGRSGRRGVVARPRRRRSADDVVDDLADGPVDVDDLRTPA